MLTLKNNLGEEKIPDQEELLSRSLELNLTVQKFEKMFEEKEPNREPSFSRMRF
jgi:hypothetical protein